MTILVLLQIYDQLGCPALQAHVTDGHPSEILEGHDHPSVGMYMH